MDGPRPKASPATLEARLNAAVESAPCGLLMSDATGAIVLVNREVERLFGYSREELVGQSVDVLVPERLQAAHPSLRHSFVTAPQARAMGAGRELFGRHKDGSEVPIEIGLTPVHTDEGLFVISSIVDISARKLAEARFRVAVESSPNGVVMVDREGTIVLVNRETERLFGYPRPELLGQPLEMLVPARMRSAHPAFRASFHSQPQARAMGAGRELFGLRKDGIEVPIEIGLNPIETEDGPVVLASIVDITARRSAERERLGLEEQLRQSQKMEALGRLAGGIAHDFNNVLAAIVGLAELALEESSGSAADLQELLRATERGRSLVGQIMRFGRREQLTKGPVDLAAAVRDSLALLRATLPVGIEIHAELEDGLPKVHADATAIGQVIMNLANNGAHAMPGGGRLEVSLMRYYVRDSVARAHPHLSEGEHLALRVADSGTGMDPETAARAFEPFFTTKPAGEGSGFGLAIVYGVVRDHGGVAWIDSELGRGTSVTCVFPIAAGDLAEAEPVFSSPSSQGRGERILFVDDEPSLGVIAGRRLERLGYRVSVFSDPVAALEEVTTTLEPYSLVISDRAMPRMSGVELSRAICALHPNLPIILASGWIEDLDDRQLSEAGVTRVLNKPFTADELAAALREVLDSDCDETS